MRPPMVLTNPDFYGTLAAARSLGRHGVPVTVAHNSKLGAASWSRFVRRTVRSPATRDSRAVLQWLLTFGASEPGQVLYPASDDAAFIYAKHTVELSKHFQLYQAPLEAVYGLLNKRRLYDEATASGLQLPRTWFPQRVSDLAQVTEQTQARVMIKPVTQILFHSRRKGAVVPSGAAVEAPYLAFANERYAPELLEYDRDVVHPMVQEFHAESGRAIYSLSGFISREGDFAMRGAMKVFQLPRRLGVGIAFEDVPVAPELAKGLITLFKRLGYFGVFEAEFICVGEERLLIDINPRFYGQMGFDVARGLPLVVLAYEGALGHTEKVAQLLRDADAPRTEGRQVFCHKNALELVLRWQETSGAMPSKEATQWRDWLKSHQAVDAVIDADDWAPAAVDSLSRIAAYARHPRAFVREIVFNR